eukprot:6975726-Prymnesium_polylepis.2
MKEKSSSEVPVPRQATVGSDVGGYKKWAEAANATEAEMITGIVLVFQPDSIGFARFKCHCREELSHESRRDLQSVTAAIEIAVAKTRLA